MKKNMALAIAEIRSLNYRGKAIGEFRRLGYSFEKIGVVFGVSYERTRQWNAKYLRRKQFLEKKIKDFFPHI